MTDAPSWRPETRLIAHPANHDPATGAVVPPLQPATTFARTPDYDPIGGRVYARDESPAFEPAEALLADLESGAEAKLFASGMAAIAGLFQALPAGSPVLIGEGLYYGARKYLEGWGRRWGLQVRFAPSDDAAAFAAAVADHRPALVYVETPSNPDWAVTDIGAVAAACRPVGAVLAVDNTAATPVFSRPIDHGADIVVHAATKYLNGHSDVLAGALVAKDADLPLWAEIGAIRAQAGAVPGAFEAWLLHRGMRTLFVRTRRAAETAAALADRFAGDKRVSAVLYPGLATHPGHAVAARQMIGGFGGMLSLKLGSQERALETVAKVRLFSRATSLGGVESLIEHRHTIEQGVSDVAPDLLRLSIGLEAPADLIADLDAAIPD